MTLHVTVIGAGASGTAAAFAARNQGANVTVIMGRPGASSLGSGALDESVARSPGEERSAAIAPFFQALGIWELHDEPCRVATTAGLLRTARGRDRALLDLARVPSGVIAVLEPSRTGWNAGALARAWTDDPWAKERGVRFEPVVVDALRYDSEHAFPDADFASLHDDPERAGWLGERLRKAHDLANKVAVMTGPWLGLKTHVARQLGQSLGKPVGETLSMPGGVAGLRFEQARDALLARIGVQRTPGWIVRVEAQGARPRVVLESGETLDTDAVILATGGLVGGGLAWSPFAPFRTSFANPSALAVRGGLLMPAGAPEGAPFDPFAWQGTSRPAGMERVGIWADASGHARRKDGTLLPWLYAAGDALADAPRTMMAAICSGLVAGAEAARGHRDGR